jgi:ABC-type transport system involved in multi-copper enzyme maturation permease subunit
MKKALVIAAREFEEKRFVAYAAVAFAILPFILAAIPGINEKSPRDVLAMSSLIFGTTFAVALGVISGASFIGRDLSDGRMSFYFSRPVSSLSIWFGKLTAALLLIVGTFAFIIIPSRLAAGTAWKHIFNAETWDGAFLLGIALSVFLIAHVIGTFARSRSPLIVFDFAAAVICGVIIWFLIVPLLAGQALTLVRGLSIALGVALAVAIIGGGAWQLERGRTDRRRNHLALSQFLWGTMAVALLIAAAYVAWVVSVKPSDLTSHIQATRSTSGPFAVITGTSKGRADYRAAFLLNSEDGSMTRVDPWAAWLTRYTRDGRSAVVPRRAGAGTFADIVIYTRGRSEPVDTGLTILDGGYVVSDDARRIATISYPGPTLSVYDVAQKRSLASVRLPDAMYLRAFFVTNDVVRVFLNVRDGMKIVELDVRAHGLRETGFIPSGNAIGAYPDPSAAHMLMRAIHGDTLTLNDARTGAPIKTLATGTQLKTGRYLRDGRIAFIDGANSAAVLHILAADGTPQRDIALGAKQFTMFIGDDGTRVVLTDLDATSGKRMLESININRGVIERREPIHEWVPSGVFDPRPPIEPLREVFYVGDAGHILAWNPATGGKRTITGA